MLKERRAPERSPAFLRMQMGMHVPHPFHPIPTHRVVHPDRGALLAGFVRMGAEPHPAELPSSQRQSTVSRPYYNVGTSSSHRASRSERINRRASQRVRRAMTCLAATHRVLVAREDVRGYKPPWRSRAKSSCRVWEKDPMLCSRFSCAKQCPNKSGTGPSYTVRLCGTAASCRHPPPLQKRLPSGEKCFVWKREGAQLLHGKRTLTRSRQVLPLFGSRQLSDWSSLLLWDAWTTAMPGQRPPPIAEFQQYGAMAAIHNARCH